MLTINRVGEILNNKKIYNRDLAKYLNKSEETISRWVNNHRQPALTDLYEIAKFLKVDIRELLHPTIWEK